MVASYQPAPFQQLIRHEQAGERERESLERHRRSGPPSMSLLTLRRAYCPRVRGPIWWCGAGWLETSPRTDRDLALDQGGQVEPGSSARRFGRAPPLGTMINIQGTTPVEDPEYRCVSTPRARRGAAYAREPVFETPCVRFQLQDAAHRGQGRGPRQRYQDGHRERSRCASRFSIIP